MASNMEVARVCKECGETKEVKPGVWVFMYGSPRGRLCARCDRTRRNIAQNKARSTEDGRLYVNEAGQKYAKTDKGRAKIAKHNSARYATPEGKLKAQKAALKWVKLNPDKANARSTRRHAAKLKRAVSWADHAKILEMYRLARELTKETGIKHVVDHEIPLRGELVSGLHVHNNLRVITQAENCKKSNKFYVG